MLKEVEWCFIFIIPCGSMIVCPEVNIMKVKRFWDKARLFTAEVDLHKLHYLGQPQDINVISNEATPL